MSEEKVSSQEIDNAAFNQIEDLNLDEAGSTNVKGGPAFMKLGDIKGDCSDRD